MHNHATVSLNARLILRLQDESVITEIAEGDKEDIDAAVAAARKAFDQGPWPKMTGAKRARVLNKFADLLEEHTEELAALETLVGFIELQ